VQRERGAGIKYPDCDKGGMIDVQCALRYFKTGVETAQIYPRFRTVTGAK